MKHSKEKGLAFAAFSVLWLADTALTILGVSRDGLSAEGNPIVRLLMENYGLEGFIIAKAVIHVAWAFVWPSTKLWVDVLLAVVMVPVVVSWVFILFIL